MFQFLRKGLPSVKEHKSEFNLRDLDLSFNKLRETAVEVSRAAASAAHVLEHEQRRTKACFTALNSASDIIFIVDNDQKIFFVNDQFVEKFNLHAYDSAVDRDLNDVLPDIDNYDYMWERIRKNKSWEDGFRGTHKLTIIPMMNGKVEPIFYICTIKPTHK
jgi:PAS domain-containing protein